MHIVKTKDLMGNEILAKHVVSKTDAILICKGTVLKKDYIPKLSELGIDFVVVEDQIAEDLSLDMEVLQKDVFENTKSVVKNLLEQHVYKQSRGLSKLCDISEEIIQNILSEKMLLERLTEIRQESTDMYSHSINVCALSTLLALKLSFDRKKVEEIAKGSILHDIGLRYISVEYENVELTEMQPNDAKEYKKHVIYGYEAVREDEWLSDLSKKIILHHHETSDGTGYPFKLKSNRTSEEIKVVAVCDAFDRKLSGIGCKKVSVQETIEYLKIHRNSEFDSKIVDVIISIVALYPVGTKVYTNEGEVGFVIKQNKDFTDRPILMIIEDKDGELVSPPRELDLLKALNTFIREPHK